MAKLHSKVVEVIGNHKEFQSELNVRLAELSNDVITINTAVCETNKGTKYVATILYRKESIW